MKRERIQWSKYRGDWTGNSPRYGPVKIQHSRKARRYYLMTNRILEAPIVLGDYATRAEAVAEAEQQPS